MEIFWPAAAMGIRPDFFRNTGSAAEGEKNALKCRKKAQFDY